MMTYNLFEKQNFFNCSNPIESLRCLQCTNFETYDLVDLKQHFQEGHTLAKFDDKLYDCDSCSLKSYSKYLYLIHNLFKLCPKDVKIKSKAYFSESSSCELELGLENITDGDMFKARKSSRLKDPTPKLKSKSTKDKLFKCKHCSHSTKYEKNLESHFLFKHTDPEKTQCFECEHCSQKSKTKSSLKRHMDVMHGNMSKMKCDYCPFESKFKDLLRKHILVKHTEPDKIQWFECEHCSYKSKTKVALKKHTTRKHIDPSEIKWFECEHCSYKTKTKTDLKRHLKCKHIDPDNVEWFECAHCSMKTKRKDHLKKHAKYKHA